MTNSVLQDADDRAQQDSRHGVPPAEAKINHDQERKFEKLKCRTEFVQESLEHDGQKTDDDDRARIILVDLDILGLRVDPDGHRSSRPRRMRIKSPARMDLYQARGVWSQEVSPWCQAFSWEPQAWPRRALSRPILTVLAPIALDSTQRDSYQPVSSNSQAARLVAATLATKWCWLAWLSNSHPERPHSRQAFSTD